MAGVFTDEGLDQLARIVTHNIANADFKLRLFVNDFHPAAGNVLADFTECTLANYAQITLLGATWTFATVAHVVSATYPEQTFVFTAGGQTLYGYYLVNNAGTKCIGAERFATPYVPAGAGGSLALTVVLEDLLCA